MLKAEAAQDNHPPCPRCGARLQRRRRRLYHRLVSVVYPVRAYGCAQCKWQGLAPSQTRLERRKRFAKVAVVLALLVLAASLAIRKYGHGLSWGRRAPAGDGIEEDGSGTPEQ